MVPPTGIAPFQERFVKVRWLPEAAISASQKLPIDAPAGRSNSTFHDVIADAPVLLIVTSSCQPVPQSETVLRLAVGAAAEAGRAIQAVATAAVVAAAASIRLLFRGMGVPPFEGGTIGADRHYSKGGTGNARCS